MIDQRLQHRDRLARGHMRLFPAELTQLAIPCRRLQRDSEGLIILKKAGKTGVTKIALRKGQPGSFREVVAGPKLEVPAVIDNATLRRIYNGARTTEKRQPG